MTIPGRGATTGGDGRLGLAEGGAGHLAWLDRPDAVGEAISSFLDAAG
jgi:hypothetical protein